jgi:hypothetical protein
MSKQGRVLQVTEELPPRATSAEVIATLDADIREAAAVARKRLEDHASQFHNTGWALEEDSWEMAALPDRMILVRVRMVREH